jgi:hypothetical protein
MSLKDDDSGQFILLMSIIVAVGLVIILVFLNQSLMAGYSSSTSIMDFPKNDIRDLRAATLNEAYDIGTAMNMQMNATPGIYNNNTSAFTDTFNVQFGNYTSQIIDLYAEKGIAVNISDFTDVDPVVYNNGTGQTIYPGYNTTISLYYNDGETSYNDTTTVYYD